MNSWKQLSVLLDAQAATEITGYLESVEALSVTTTAASDEELFVAHAGEVAEGTSALWQRCRVVALFDRSADIDPVVEQISARCPGAHCSVEVLEDEDWLMKGAVAAVSASFAGGRLRLEPRAAKGEVVDPATIFLDAGLAFGSGSHATTRLCLEWLANTPLTGLRCLDFGCGSGILALAMCKLGATSVAAVDIDPQALLATRNNGHYNGIPDAQLQIFAPDQFQPETTFNVVVANILANPLIELAPILSPCVVPGGVLCLTGVLAPQVTAVAAAYPEFALAVCDEQQEDGPTWVRLEGRRRADT